MVTQALHPAQELVTRFADLVEAVSPGHPHGRQKADPMIALCRDAEQAGSNFQLSTDARALFPLVALLHDLGRFYDVIAKQAGEIGLVNAEHGGRSVAVMSDPASLEKFAHHPNMATHRQLFEAVQAQKKALDGSLGTLSGESLDQLRQAIRYHSERNVPLDPTSIAGQLCFALRDLDILEILRDRATYIDARGIVEQALIWGFKSHAQDERDCPGFAEEKVKEIRSDPMVVARLEKIVSDVFAGRETSDVTTGSVEDRLIRFLRGPVPEQFVQSFERGELCNKNLLEREHPFTQGAYFLMSICTSFGLTSPWAREQAKGAPVPRAAARLAEQLLRGRGDQSLALRVDSRARELGFLTSGA